jgi:transposase
MGQKMKSYKRVIGIDISTERLDVADSNAKIVQEVDYTIDDIKSKILKFIKKPSETLVVCEATGGLEYELVDMLHDAKIDVVVANPARIRDFAKGHGFLEKSDKIDAKPRTLQERNFIALTRRRTQLLQLISQESNRRRQSNDPQVRAFLDDMLKSLKTQMKTVDSCIEKALGEQAKTNPTIDVIRSVPGVGVVLTATLVAELPELGTISRTKIAKLVGVAPMIKQSGKSDERRRARGGRGGVRRVLYMATLAATQKNEVIKKRYIRLVSSGKPKKLALVACMRTLLTILNDMARHQTKWGEEKKSVAGSVVSNRPAPAHVLDKI